MQCKNCNKEIVPDPTDSESWVHDQTGDGACDPKIVDAWAEPEGTEVNHIELHLSQKISEMVDELATANDTLIKANKTITNLFRKEPLQYPEIAEKAIVRTLTLEKINAEVELSEVKKAGGEALDTATAFKNMLMMIHQEVVNVEKIDPNNRLAKNVRRILGSPEDFPERQT